MKILILNDGREVENWGLQACMEGLLKIFEGNVIDTISFSTITNKFTFNPKIFGRNFFNENSRIQKSFFKENLRTPFIADDLDYCCDLWINGRGGTKSKEIISSIIESDIILFNAEGSTYRKNIAAFRGLFILYFAKKYFKKKTYFINGSVTLSSVDATLPSYIKKVFNVIDGVFVREKKSLLNIIEHINFSKVTVVPDSVFALDTQNLNLNRRSGFCFSLSMLPMQRFPINKDNAIIQMLNKISSKYGECTLLAKDIEDQYLKKLAPYIGAKFLGPNHTYEDVENCLRNSKLLISGRYHHLIFALRQGCPIIGLKSSSHKVEGLLDFFGELIPPIIDPTDLRNEIGNIEKYLKKFDSNTIFKDIYVKSKALKDETERLKNCLN